MPKQIMLCAAVAAAWAPSAATADPGAEVAPATATAPPASHYAQPPVLSGARLSPDGTRIAAMVTLPTGTHISVWTVDAGPEQRPKLIQAKSAQSLAWAGDHRLLVDTLGLALKARRDTIYLGPSRQVTVVDLRTNRVAQLGSDNGVFEEVIHVAPDGGSLLLSVQETITTTPSVQRIDLATGAETLLEPARKGVWSWHADAEGVVRVGVDYGDKRTALHYRGAAGAPLRRVVPRRNIATDTTIDKVHFITNSSRGLIVSNAETGRFGVYDYDFGRDVQGATVFEHAEVDVDGVVLGPDGSLEGVRYVDDKPRVRWLKPELNEMQAAIDRTLAGKTNQIIDRSRDGNRLLIFSTGASDPGIYLVYDRAAKRMQRFASPYELLYDAPHAEVRPVRYRSRDGLTINAYLTLPRGREARNLPLVLLPHGGPFARDHWAFDPEVQFLASRGYAVLQANFRGSTGYGREFVARGFGQLGAGMIDDLEDGVDWAAREGMIDPRRVCVMGSSYGGYAAIWAAMRNPARYRCAISWAGPSDLRSMLKHSARGFSARRYFREFRNQIVGDPPVDLSDISPARQAARLRTPALIAHGRADHVVPVEQSERLIAALKGAKARNVETVIYPKSGHNFEETSERADFLRRLEAFLARHNPATAAPAADFSSSP